MERGPHQNSGTVTLSELDKISKDRENKRLSSSAELGTSAQGIHFHSKINTSLPILSKNLKQCSYENVHTMLNTGGK